MAIFYLPQIDKERCLSWSVEMSPCQAACPLGIDIEGYLAAIAEGDFKKSLQIIREKCCLPAVCGRVCHHPCETECKRGVVDEPLAIRALKRFAADDCAGLTQEQATPERTRKEKIAIIGSGPAGLSAAHELAMAGFGVTIFEAMNVPGGMLAHGIPEFNLPQAIVQGEIDYIRSLGVEIKTGIRVGLDISLQEIKDQGWGAILIATGAQESLRLPVPGGDLAGIQAAIPFLRRSKLEGGTALSGRVVVLGGGNVAVDAARTAVRLGAAEVRMICLESREELPAGKDMKEEAEREGVIIETCLSSHSLQSDDGKNVSRIVLRRVTSFCRTREGQISFTVCDDSKEDVVYDVSGVIVAIGQRPESVNPDGNFDRQKGGTLVCDSSTGATNRDSIFGTGDIVNNPGMVTTAMADGRKVAESIIRFLDGKECVPRGPGREPYTGKEIIPHGILPEPRRLMGSISPGDAVKSFREVELGFTRQQAMEEAARCLRCKTCNRCALETRCVSLNLTENEEKRSPCVKAMICAGCGRCTRNCPFAMIHLEQFE
ncbi:MAG: FAD-binding protein [Deltaproteobacteria bacterium]|nr:FAD-binding protein [Deltaproteobacteria bacterium]